MCGTAAMTKGALYARFMSRLDLVPAEGYHKVKESQNHQYRLANGGS